MRKTEIVTIEREGRDKGRSYLLTEMPAMRIEKWAAKALLALGRSGVEVSDDIASAGAAAILAAGIGSFAKIAFEDAEPLMDEMMECVSIIPDQHRRDPMSNLPVSRPLIEDDIEELATLLQIRGGLFELHLGFSVTAALSMLGTAEKPRRSRTRTSRRSSDKSSDAA